MQASGTAKGAYYESQTNQLQLMSDVHIVTTGDNAADIFGSSGTIQKDPRQAVLFNAAIYEPDRTLTTDKLTMLFEPDNTIQHAQAEGNVNIEVRGPTIVDISGPRGDLNMGPQNAVLQAIVTGGAKYNTRGDNLSHGSADTFVLDFEADNQPKYFHMIKNARMRQEPQPGKSGSPGQPMEIVADQLHFVLENGNELKTGDTVGKAQITIFPSPAGPKPAKAAPKAWTGLRLCQLRPPLRLPASSMRPSAKTIACRRCMARPKPVSSPLRPASRTRSAPRRTSTSPSLPMAERRSSSRPATSPITNPRPSPTPADAPCSPTRPPTLRPTRSWCSTARRAPLMAA